MPLPGEIIFGNEDNSGFIHIGGKKRVKRQNSIKEQETENIFKSTTLFL